MYKLISVVDFDADPDSTFHFDPDPTPSFTHVGKKLLSLTTVLYRQFHWCHYFQYFGQYIEIFWNKE